MIKNFKFIIITLLGLFLFIVLLKGLDKTNNYSPDKISTKIETSLSARTLYINKEISLGELINKKNFSIINFWASWCLPCRNEHAYLLSLQKTKILMLLELIIKTKKLTLRNFLKI